MTIRESGVKDLFTTTHKSVPKGKKILMLRLNPGRLDTQGVRADLALYLGSKLKLEQEEGLTCVLASVSLLD